MSLVDWLREQGHPEEVDGKLIFHPVPPKCIVCTGPLIGSEIHWGSCGHCGGRSISRGGFPSARPGKDRP